MKNMKHYTKFVFAFIAAFTLAANTAEAQIVCNKFNLVTKVTGSTLELSVDTDLPDNTVVMVSVSRSYLERGMQLRIPWTISQKRVPSEHGSCYI